ncbi:hypothetical protein [Motilibacter deserti]|uniref:DUF1579 domain-containing protein n=1 Tax=Motilibacter deserti TaxID=2714956 RepID=A0ABX0GYI7_9ACTN|nr:hypothetical protein [Motilibacter deserti]NHC14660.1 hypothetical protein [Motilibacter deserti]
MSADFDFLLGRWQVHNRKLRDNTDPDCTEWVEFAATSEAVPVLHGIGNVDRMHVPDPPDGEPFEGLTLRLFDPAAGTWSIWWSSTRAPGRLDPPVVGRFTDGHGVFTGDDTLRGRPVRVSFEWHAGPGCPTWRQSFSWDGGATWVLNWVMTLHPAP